MLVGPRSASIVLQDLTQPLAALQAGGVVDQVRRHEVVEHRVVAGPQPPEDLVDDVLRRALGS